MVKRQISIHGFQLPVLVLQLPQLPELVDFHTGIFFLPVIESGARYAQFPANVVCFAAGLFLVKYFHDLCFGESSFFHKIEFSASV